MSYSVYTIAPAATVNDAIDTLAIAVEHLPEADEQLTAGKASAKAIIASGALGKTDYWQVSISGHANPDHAVTTGYANDCIAVNIVQSSEQGYNSYIAAVKAAEQNAS